MLFTCVESGGEVQMLKGIGVWGRWLWGKRTLLLAFLLLVLGPLQWIALVVIAQDDARHFVESGDEYIWVEQLPTDQTTLGHKWAGRGHAPSYYARFALTELPANGPSYEEGSQASMVAMVRGAAQSIGLVSSFMNTQRSVAKLRNLTVQQARFGLPMNDIVEFRRGFVASITSAEQQSAGSKIVAEDILVEKELRVKTYEIGIENEVTHETTGGASERGVSGVTSGATVRGKYINGNNLIIGRSFGSVSGSVGTFV
jgi:hypothetical protein